MPSGHRQTTCTSSLNHINPYTGIAYKDEPHVIGFEVCNEPHHDGPHEKVTAFINEMVASMRQTGCTKPVFYNMSHSIHLVDAYLSANIQGGTFQWYPTGLVASRTINGNFLPQVKSYQIPFAGNPKFEKNGQNNIRIRSCRCGRKYIVSGNGSCFSRSRHADGGAVCLRRYVLGSILYDYGTHFMNLAYAPNKAISLKIASAIFHEVDMYKKQNDNMDPGACRISYPDDLAEWITNEKFFYSNNTSSRPANISQLREIAGCGSSSLVKYSGTGAYFLDKLSNGVSRLEVMPDAYWIADPYSPVSPSIQKAAVLHAQQQMTISVPDLGECFSADPINSGNTFKPRVSNGQT